MRMGPGNDGPDPSEHILRAILHAAAAGACEVAARQDAAHWTHWLTLAEDQHGKAETRLHLAASDVRASCAAASISRVTPRRRSFE